MHTRFRLALPFVFVLFSMGAAHADRDLSKAGDAAFHSLMTASVFSDSAVGYAGKPSQHVLAFRVLLGEDEAAWAFSRLVQKGSTAGQLYGLAGLYFTDKQRFDQEVTRLGASKQAVDTQFGCSRVRVPVADLVRKTGAMRIPAGKTMRQWLVKNGSAPRDIAGGGFPLDFAGPGTTAVAD